MQFNLNLPKAPYCKPFFASFRMVRWKLRTNSTLLDGTTWALCVGRRKLNLKRLLNPPNQLSENLNSPGCGDIDCNSCSSLVLNHQPFTFKQHRRSSLYSLYRISSTSGCSADLLNCTRFLPFLL